MTRKTKTLVRSDDANALVRAAPMASASWNKDELTFDLVLSAGSSVRRADERGQFNEVLDLAGATWVEPIPLLDSHRQGSLDDNLGDVFNIRRESNQIVGTVRLSRHSPKAQRIAAEINDGRSFSASVGYRVGNWAESRPAGKRTLTATSWVISEASLVSVPADPNAKIRSIPLTKKTTTSETVVLENADDVATVTRAQINAHIRSAAKTAGLDQAWVDAQIDADATIEGANSAALSAMQARTAAAGSIRSTGAQIGTDHTDPVAIRTAMADAIAHRLAPDVVKLEGRAQEFRSHRLLDMIGDIAVSRGERINLRDQDALLERAVGAHSTSDFPLLLADATNKALLANYQLAEPTYRKWASRKTFNDFRDHSFLRVGDFPAFKPVNENGEFKYGTLSESREKVRVKEFGTGIAVGRQLLINDDLSALSDFSSMIAIRAANDENKLVYSVLTANAALADGVALFHANHGNLPTAGALAEGTLGLAIAALRNQKSLDGLPLNLQPAFLVVGTALEVTARKILAAVNATKTADVNPWAGVAELVVDANLGATEWYVFASPAAAPVVVYGYLSGSEGPQVRTEIDFDTRAVKVAAGLDFGTNAIDFRGAVKNAGT